MALKSKRLFGSVLSKNPDEPSYPPQQEVSPQPIRNPFMLEQPGRWAVALVLAGFALSGYTAIVYQVVWTRVLSLSLGSSIYAFSAMLTTFLLGLALGSAFFTQVLHRIKQPTATFALIQIGIGISCYVGAIFLERLPYFFLNAISWGLPAFYNHPDWLIMGLWFIATMVIMFIPTFLFGGTFPVVIKLYQSLVQQMGRSTGDAYSVNTIGAVIGAFMGGFILIPALGLQATLLVTILINLILGAALSLSSPAWTSYRKGIVGGSIVALSLMVGWWNIPWNPIMMTFNLGIEYPTYLKVIEQMKKDSGWTAFKEKMTRNVKLDFYEEGKTATVTVVRDPEGNRLLKNDGRPEGGEQYLRTHVLLGHLPMMVGGPETGKREAMLSIGLGTGVTLGSTQLYPVQRLDAVEIEPAVVRAADHFSNMNQLKKNDPRLNIIINDGRNHLLTTHETYDIITSQPSLPWLSGVSNLFTQDYFQLGANRLKEGGIFCQWISIYGMTEENFKSVLKAFQSVFPHVMVFDPAPPDIILLGSVSPIEINIGTLAAALEDKTVQGDMKRIQIQSISDLLSTFALGSNEVNTYLSDSVANTDDNAWVEVNGPLDYYSGRINGQPEAIRENMLKQHANLTHYINGFSHFPNEVQADLLLKLAYAYLRQNSIHRKDSLGYAHFYSTRSMETHETPQGHLLMAKLLFTLAQNIPLESAQQTPPTAYLEAALKAAETALQINPTFFEAQLFVGNLYARLGRVEKAIPAFQKSIQMNPKFPDPYFALATLLQAQGNTLEAKKYFESFLRMAPNSGVYQQWIRQAEQQLRKLNLP
jgi:spermidine synthase